MKTVTTAFWTRTGSSSDASTFEGSAACSGPWDPGSCHGGPPSALLVHCLDATAPRPDLRLARVTAEILGPVPVGEVQVRTRVLRTGRRVELLEGVLSAGGRDAVRMNGWRIATSEAVPVPPPEPVPAFPEQPQPGLLGWTGPLDGPVTQFIEAMEWRMVSGGFGDLGPAVAWTRPRLALVDGEDASGFARTMLLADCGNGLSAELRPDEWYFINPDLTVLLHREPVGEWLCADARTVVDASGIGMATTTLFDAGAAVGRGLQSLLVTRR